MKRTIEQRSNNNGDTTFNLSDKKLSHFDRKKNSQTSMAKKSSTLLEHVKVDMGEPQLVYHAAQ
jgi:hypothetical protein